MESNPTVAAVMLVNGRPEMVRRAVKAFEEQTYPNAKLVVLDTSTVGVACHQTKDSGPLVWVWRSSLNGSPIGELRNFVNQYVAGTRREIIVHFDSDDFSHPDRIAEQVALLQASGADCVGYREMLFWNETRLFWIDSYPKSDEAWLYTNPEQDFCLGTSLCYWRSVWERKPFEALPVAPGGIGEDWKFQQGLKRTAVSSLVSPSCFSPALVGLPASGSPVEPRMIASIHGGNTSDYSIIDNPKQRSFRRVPEWDEHCRKVMEGGAVDVGLALHPQ